MPHFFKSRSSLRALNLRPYRPFISGRLRRERKFHAPTAPERAQAKPDARSIRLAQLPRCGRFAPSGPAKKNIGDRHSRHQDRSGQHRQPAFPKSRTAGSRCSKIDTALPNGDLVVRVEHGPDRFTLIQGGYNNLITQIGIVEMQQRFKIAVPIGEDRHSFIQPGIDHDDLGIRYGAAAIIVNRSVNRKTVVDLMCRKGRG